MDRAFVSCLTAAVAAAGAVVAGAQEPPAAAGRQCGDFYAAGGEIDNQSGLAVFREFRLTCDNWSLEADEVTAADSDVTATGNVRARGVVFKVDGAGLEAGSAVFTFADHMLATATLDGGVRFADTNELRTPATGTADSIVYDHRERTIQLIAAGADPTVRLIRGPSEVSSCAVVYDFDNEKLGAGGTCGLRIRTLPANDAAAAPATDP